MLIFSQRGGREEDARGGREEEDARGGRFGSDKKGGRQRTAENLQVRKESWSWEEKTPDSPSRLAGFSGKTLAEKEDGEVNQVGVGFYDAYYTHT